MKNLNRALVKYNSLNRPEIKPTPCDVWKKSFETAKVEDNYAFSTSVQKGVMNTRLSRIQSTLLTPCDK